MRDFQIGDIVTPSTPIRHEQLGNGIIIYGAPHYRVVFPSAIESFFVHDFPDQKLKLVEVDWSEQVKINQARDLWHAIESGIKGA